MHMKKFSILLVFLISVTSSFCQGKFSLSIKSIGLPNINISEYVYKNYNLSVWSNSELIEKLRLSEKQCITVDSIITSIGIENLNNTYERKNIKLVIDGVTNNQMICIDDGRHLYFKFGSGKKGKTIFLDNYYHDKLDVLLRYLNSTLKTESQIISFGKTFQLPDTVIYYYPEFMNMHIELPDTNFRITDITSYRRGHFATEILDSTIQCRCRISRKDEFHARKYWMLYRIDERNWRREFYADNETVSLVEYLREIFPMEIIHEVVEIHEGVKPSVIISRYYKTELIKIKE